MRSVSLFSMLVLVFGEQDEATSSCVISQNNPNGEESMPTVSAPLELVGFWEGSNCGLNDPESVPATLKLDQDGVNIWSFADKETGILLPQTGDHGVEAMVGWQCIDVGKGYWWGRVPYSDVLWCNLFQVKQVVHDATTNDGDALILVSYTNLAYGGQGVGATVQ